MLQETSKSTENVPLFGWVLLGVSPGIVMTNHKELFGSKE